MQMVVCYPVAWHLARLFLLTYTNYWWFLWWLPVYYRFYSKDAARYIVITTYRAAYFWIQSIIYTEPSQKSSIVCKDKRGKWNATGQHTTICIAHGLLNSRNHQSQNHKNAALMKICVEFGYRCKTELSDLCTVDDQRTDVTDNIDDRYIDDLDYGVIDPRKGRPATNFGIT